MLRSSRIFPRQHQTYHHKIQKRCFVSSSSSLISSSFTSSSKRHHGSCCNHSHSSHSSEFFKPATAAADKNEPVNPDVEWCKKLTWTGAAVNLVYGFLKITLGATGGSVALVADGLHAVVDVGSDIVAIGSLYLARMPRLAKRCKFPFGTGRAETVGAVIIALILTLGAFSVAYAAVEKLFDHAATPWKKMKTKIGMAGSSADSDNSEEAEGSNNSDNNKHDHHHHHDHHHDHNHGLLDMFTHDHSFEVIGKEGTIVWSMLFVASSSILAKELLYRLMLKAGTKAGSSSTVANAYHHRADALSAALGLGGVASSAYGLELLDALAGLGVSAVILQLGTRTLKASVLQFFDYQSGDLKDIRNIARGTSEKGTAVNVFATRHGVQVVLHGTLLMKKEATCKDVAFLESAILEKVTKEHPNVLFDVFFKVRAYNTKQIEAPVASTAAEPKSAEKKATGNEKGEEEAEKKIIHTEPGIPQITHVSDLIVGLSSALAEVAQFHGIDIETAITRDDEKKVVKIHQDLGADCRGDLERCSRLFNYDVVFL